MIRFQRLSLFLLLASSLFVSPSAAQESSPKLTERMLSDHPGLREGTYEVVREDWIAALESDPESPLAYSAAVCIARMTGQILEATLSADRLWALAERVPEARASKALRIAALSAFQEKRFAQPETQPPAEAFPDHVKHFAVLGALGPYDRGAVLRHEPALDVRTLQPLPGSLVGQDAEWRALERPGLAWNVEPERLIYPRGSGEGWLLALIKTQPGQARIRVESMISFQAWWNGERALNEMRTSWADLGYDVDVDVEALEGWNALLIRFVGGAEPDFGVQVLDSSGRRVSHESFDFESLENDWTRLPALAQNEGRTLTRVPFEINRQLDSSSPWSKALSVAMDGYGRRSDRALSREVPSDEDPAAAAFWRARHIAVRQAIHLPGEVYRRLQLEAEAALDRLGVTFPEIELARIERNLEEELVTESVTEARELVESYPNCAELRYLIATALDYLDATGTLGTLERKRILQDRPRDVSGWLQVANRAFDAGDIATGIATQRRILELDGERTDTLSSLIERLSLGTEAQVQEAYLNLFKTLVDEYPA
ncbi:MAG: hypothetical protein AAF368_08085, partial [Planctomycetota bacterium]